MQRQRILSTLILLSSVLVPSQLRLLAFRAPGAAAINASPNHAAALTGKIRFEGALPKLQPIAMRSDPACSKEHPGPVHAQDVLTGQDGALANVIVFIAEGIPNGNYDVPQNTVRLEQKGCLYEPHVLAMRAGQTLTIVNNDGTAHNIHPMPSNNREWNKAQAPGQVIEEKFAREEVSIPVKCNIHPWMHSYIAVFKHPYFAVTGADGSFRFPNLPPGQYTIKAWHEKLGTVTQQVKISSLDSNKVDFVFKAH